MSHFIIVGLGNPGEAYENTRHNTGRILVEAFRRKYGLPDWKEDKKRRALVSFGKLKTYPPSLREIGASEGRGSLQLILPETFMNKSGVSLGSLLKSKKAALRLVVVHDDLDIPFGRFKISFNRSSGGHRGVESIVRFLKTEAFIRLRAGISPPGAKGAARKPRGEEAVNKFILSSFKPAELAALKGLSKKVSEALATIVSEGREKAMGEWNKF